MDELKFIYKKPAIKYKDALIIGDTHFGIETRLKTKGIYSENITERIVEEIVTLIKETKAKKLIIAGDVKDRIGVMDDYTIWALEEISKKAEITIVKGNHDGGINFKGVKIVGSEGYLYGDISICHGHAWPNKKLFNARYLLNAHQHPVLAIKDKGGKKHKERVWLVCPPNNKEIKKRYPIFNKNIKLIIMPAFNPIVGSEITNESLGPLLNNKLFKLISSNIYKLNGLFLGKFLSRYNYG